MKHLLPDYQKVFNKFFEQAADVRRSGAAALDLAYVAAGRYDGFWEAGLKIWDTAAGELLVREAGGVVTDFAGGMNYSKSGNIVAGAPKVLQAMVFANASTVAGSTEKISNCLTCNTVSTIKKGLARG